MAGPVRVPEMSPSQHHQVGAAGRQDGVDVGGRRDVADRHGGDPRLVPDPVAERRLELAPVDRLGVGDGLPRGDVHDVGARGHDHHSRTSTESCASMPPGAQSTAEIRTESGLAAGHAARTRVTISSGYRIRFASGPAVLVGAAVGERRDERRQQVAVGQVKLEQIEAGGVRHAGGADEVVRHLVHVGPGHLPGHLAVGPGTGWATARSAASCLRAAAGPLPPTARRSSLCARRGRAGCRSWPRSRRARSPRSAATR